MSVAMRVSYNPAKCAPHSFHNIIISLYRELYTFLYYFPQWFPRYKGLVNGFIVAGFGGGAFIFDFVQTAFINPMNVKAVNASVLNTTQDIGDNK